MATASKKRCFEDSRLTQFSENVPLANVHERIRTMKSLEVRRYLELVDNVQADNHHDQHELDLIKALLEARQAKLDNEILLNAFEELTSDHAISFSESRMTIRTLKKCSLGGVSDGSLNLVELEQMLLQEDGEISHVQLTTEQRETVEELEKEMTYKQLFENIEELPPTDTTYPPSDSDDLSFASNTESFDQYDEPFYNPRKSMRSKVFHNLVVFTKRLPRKLARLCPQRNS